MITKTSKPKQRKCPPMGLVIQDSPEDVAGINLELRRLARIGIIPQLIPVDSGGNWTAIVIAPEGTSQKDAQEFHDLESGEA